MSCVSIKLREFLERESRILGFSSLGIASAEDDIAQISHLRSYLSSEYHGQMDWLSKFEERRSKVKSLWGDVKSVVMLTMNYTPSFDPLAVLDQSHKGAVSVYAQNRDYHTIIKGRLKELGSKLLSRSRELSVSGDIKVFVDTAPIMEKPLAARAGLGWQGKHTNLVSKDLGSWFFLGSIFTTFDLPIDSPHVDNCGSCTSCLDICPTDAFPSPYVLDSRRCISYLTIEHDGLIDEWLRPLMGNRIYGCDDCLAVCPWNKFARVSNELKLRASGDSDDLIDLLKLDDAGFRKKFSGSAIKRIGRVRFIRNCLIAAGNSGEKRLKACVESLLSDSDTTISQTARWALERL